METKSLLARTLVVLAMAVGFLATLVPQANASTPCCDITKIDARTGVVTAQDRTTGHTFEFTASPAVLQKLKVGQGIYANFKTNQVSLNNGEPCCNITKSGGMAATRGLPNPNNGQPCCGITQIDKETGVVTAINNITGHSFQFTASPSVLQSLKVGQPVYANFKSKQVSLNNAQPCCNIVNMGGAAPTSPKPPSAGRGATQIAPVDGFKTQTQIAPVDGAKAGTQIAPVDGVTAGKQIAPVDGNKLGVQIAPVDGVKAGTQIAPVDGVTAGKQIAPVDGNKLGAQIAPVDGAKAGTQIAPVDGIKAGKQIAPVDGDKLGTQIAPVDGVKAGSPAPKSQSGQGPPGPLPVVVNTRSVDPCAMFTAAQLQQYIAPQINSAFPIVYSTGGESLAIKNPDLRSVTCAPLQIQAHTDLQYKKTRGFPQFSTSGDASFQTGVVGRVASTAPSNAPITASDFQSASLCLTDVNVTSLNLRNVPNWLDNTWLRDYLNQQLVVGNQCQDISVLVSLYLSNGGAIPPASPAGTPATTGSAARFQAKGSSLDSPVHGGSTGILTPPIEKTLLPTEPQSSDNRNQPLNQTDTLQTRQGKAPGGSQNGAGTNPPEASMPVCSQHHPGRQNRLESVAKSGAAVARPPV